MKFLFACFLMTVSSLSTFTFAHAQDVYIARPKSERDPRQEYVFELLNYALNYRSNAASINVRYSEHIHSRKRLHQLMLEGRKVDIQATATRIDWEESLIPIRVPIFKGLLGYRVFLINEDNQPTFSGIKELEQLKKMQAILGAQWSITPVWEAHNFKTIKNGDYDSLFKIIHFKRADYFPRGMNEVTQELTNYQPKYPKLAIERKLAVYMPLPMYFFVTPHKPELAERLKTNLEAMIESGDFDRQFNAEYQEVMNQLAMNQRRTFYLTNPHLPDATPLNRKELWYISDINTLQP